MQYLSPGATTTAEYDNWQEGLTESHPVGILPPGGYAIVGARAHANAAVHSGSFATVNATETIMGNTSSSTSKILSVTKNSALSSGSLVTGSAQVKIGSFAVSASNAEGVNVSNVTIGSGQNANMLENLRVMINGVQFGTTQPLVASNDLYTFSGSPFSVPAGSTVNVDVYADVLLSAQPGTAIATSFSGCAATGATSDASYTCTSAAGQTMTVVTVVPPSLSVSLSAGSPPPSVIIMGSTGNTVAAYNFIANSNQENIEITDLRVAEVTTSTEPDVTNLGIWNGTTLLGTGNLTSVAVPGGYVFSFHFANPIIVPAGNAITLTLKADADAYSSGEALDDSVASFQIATSSAVTAIGQSSNATAKITASAIGNPMTILRTTVTAATTPSGSSKHVKSASDQLGTITVAASNAGPAELQKLSVAFSGSAATTALLNSQNITLLDANGNNLVSASEAALSISQGVATWTFANGGFQIPAGSNYTFTLRVNSSAVAPIANIIESLNANLSGLTYADGINSGAVTGLGLPSSAYPIIINSVSYPVGQ